MIAKANNRFKEINKLRTMLDLRDGKQVEPFQVDISKMLTTSVESLLLMIKDAGYNLQEAFSWMDCISYVDILELGNNGGNLTRLIVDTEGDTRFCGGTVGGLITTYTKEELKSYFSREPTNDARCNGASLSVGTTPADDQFSVILANYMENGKTSHPKGRPTVCEEKSGLCTNTLSAIRELASDYKVTLTFYPNNTIGVFHEKLMRNTKIVEDHSKLVELLESIKTLANLSNKM